LAWGKHIWDHREAWSIVKEVSHPSVGVILDSFHSLARAIPIESLADIDPTRIFIVQLADAPMMQTDYLSWSRHFRCMPGQGDFPLVDYVAALRGRGYTGILSLEIFNDRFRSTSAADVALAGHRSLTFLSDQVARRLAPTLTVDLPPRAHVRGIEFTEFAANETEAKQLETLFTQLGFVPAGKHRTKEVTRWRQNGINFVINSEPDSFARGYDSVHGASLCALGLSVENVSSALSRAQALQILQFSQLRAPEELWIPAIRGVGDSLIYFLEAGCEAHIWDSEFTPVACSADSDDAGLLRVDHIVQTMHYEEMLSWALYYVALFDVTKAPVVLLADPLGLVQSQAIESPEGSFRITLNGSAAPQTLSARFLQGFHGAGVQHIALATSDILSSARRLRELGLATLPIPANYYEDLEARFGLDTKLLERLQEFGILYDRDADGEYFQLVSRAFAKRFFFEIVERRGYRSYGAANASIRLAAQSRYREDWQREGERTSRDSG